MQTGHAWQKTKKHTLFTGTFLSPGPEYVPGIWVTVHNDVIKCNRP